MVLMILCAGGGGANGQTNDTVHLAGEIEISRIIDLAAESLSLNIE